jgi:hypothetical protein
VHFSIGIREAINTVTLARRYEKLD